MISFSYLRKGSTKGSMIIDEFGVLRKLNIISFIPQTLERKGGVVLVLEIVFKWDEAVGEVNEQPWELDQLKIFIKAQ